MTDADCTRRWHNHLNPEIRKDPWTPEEESTIIRAYTIYEHQWNKWAQIAKLLPGISFGSLVVSLFYVQAAPIMPSRIIGTQPACVARFKNFRQHKKKELLVARRTRGWLLPRCRKGDWTQRWGRHTSDPVASLMLHTLSRGNGHNRPW